MILPVSDDPRIKRIMEYTVEHLASASLLDVFNVVGMSSRTLGRKLAVKMGMSREEFRLRCRLFKAIELLEYDSVLKVEIAMRVGDKSHSAFSKSFKNLLQ